MRMHTSTWLKRFAPLTLCLLALGGCSSSDDDGRSPSGDAGTDISDGGGNGTPDGGGGTPDGGPAGTGCMGETFLTSLGKNRLLVGAQMEDSTAAGAPFDVHYLYVASGLVDSTNICTSCTSGCTTSGTSCAGASCAWWGCWQDVSQPPGAYVRGHVSGAKGRQQLPFITYYQQLLGGVGPAQEGEQQLQSLNDVAIMRRYFADWRFTLQQVGSERALLHIEPDLWGYLQFFSNGDPATVPAQVASANATDCAGMARKVADFLLKLGAADTDFIVVEASDRDAGFYDSIGEDTWWDANNATLPHFRQAFTWASAISERLNKPNFWWQLPVGNMNLPNTNQKWKDNRVDYFFSHTAELAAAHSVGFSFGAGEGRQTSPETDNGNLSTRVSAYKRAGGQAPCAP